MSEESAAAGLETTPAAPDDDDRIHVAFVCVQNAGRSQMSTAFAERERQRRGLEDTVAIHTGGTDPAEHVHDVVVETMAETDLEALGVHLAEREPREISTEELEACDYVATMGCSTLELEADGVDVRDWALPDPDGKAPERVREIRETVRERVRALFDEVESALHEETTSNGESALHEETASNGETATAENAEDAADD